jgi:serine/threonine-protein kinase HipA
VDSQLLEVFLHGRRAGTLRRKDNGNLQFLYDHEYIEAAGQPLSLRLPLREEGFSHRDCLAFFGNLLPEEDVRAQLALATGISASNDYRLLERFGGDVAGAITLLVPGEPPPAAGRGGLEPLSPDRLDEILSELPQRPLAADEAGEVRLSLAGAQSKLPVTETESGFALPHGSDLPTTHILKPEPARFPGLVANEFFCMRLAAAVGLEVAEVDRTETLSGLPYLVVSRYDRDLTQEPVRRLHQEDLCQALGKPHFEKYQAEGGPAVLDAMALIDEASTAPARDRPQLWLALVFNVLIGNCDAHGKNYSLLYDSRAPRLAPLYDLVSTAVYGELTQRLAMSIDGAKELDGVGYSAWQRLAAEIQFAPRFLEQRMAPFVKLVREAVLALASEPEHSDEIAGGIDARAGRLLPPVPS